MYAYATRLQLNIDSDNQSLEFPPLGRMRFTRVKGGSTRSLLYPYCTCFAIIWLMFVITCTLTWWGQAPLLNVIRRVDANRSCYSSTTALEYYGHMCKSYNSISSNRVYCRGLPVALHCIIPSGVEMEESCREWSWDVANKTLSFKAEDKDHQSLTAGDNSSDSYRSICTIPEVNNNMVRKIIYANSTVQFPGCTLDKAVCEWPYYDYALHMRINTDPCCRRILMNMTNNVASLLDQYSVQYVLISGAVIGWVRDKSFIPYDHDIDIIIDIKDKDKFEKIANESFPKLGYVLQRLKGGFFWIWPGKRHVIGPDVWYFTKNDKDLVIGYRGWNKQPISNVLPRQRGTLEGYQFWFPAKPVEYLDVEYGKDKWRKVLKCTKMTGKTCSE